VSSQYAKVSLTLPSRLVERIRERVGTRGLSRYVAQALEAEERREALRAWLAGQDAEHGPVPAETIEEVRRQWLDAARAAS
jgi:post-segregation antitoxin (ccd killing protein)